MPCRTHPINIAGIRHADLLMFSPTRLWRQLRRLLDIRRDQAGYRDLPVLMGFSMQKMARVQR
jgi:hypothetical protein